MASSALIRWPRLIVGVMGNHPIPRSPPRVICSMPGYEKTPSKSLTRIGLPLGWLVLASWPWHCSEPVSESCLPTAASNCYVNAIQNPIAEDAGPRVVLQFEGFQHGEGTWILWYNFRVIPCSTGLAEGTSGYGTHGNRRIPMNKEWFRAKFRMVLGGFCNSRVSSTRKALESFSTGNVF